MHEKNLPMAYFSGGDKMIGFLFSIIAGAAMSVQGVMNTRLQDRVGLWEANAFVQGTAFVLSLIVMWIFGKGDWKALLSAPKWNLLGGALGLIITVTVMLSIKGLNPTVAISTILIAQLLVAAAIEYFGWMGQEKAAFAIKQWLGLALMLGGVVLFKWK
jgi:transporter family-2 protein